jgi:hypothetical protein
MQDPDNEELKAIENKERPTDNRDAGDWGTVGRIGTFGNRPGPDEELLVETMHTYGAKN